MEKYIWSHEMIQKYHQQKTFFIHWLWRGKFLLINISKAFYRCYKLCQKYNWHKWQGISNNNAIKKDTVVQGPWVKKSCDQDFDVPMGCFDGAEVCDTTGLFLLHQLSHIFKKSDIDLYRDGSVGIIQNMRKPEIEWMKKTIVKVFKECGLSNLSPCILKELLVSIEKRLSKHHQTKIYLTMQRNYITML